MAGNTKVFTISSIPTAIGQSPTTVTNAGQATHALGYNPAHVRRTFSLNKTEFLLGEPILVGYSVKLDGTGKWDRDDWLYHNNRDETFIILMRGQDGRWVPDRYHRESFYLLGGEIASETFDQNNPENHWLPVQHYCAVTNVGKYELFCMRWNTLCRQVEHYPVSPLRTRISGDIIAEVDSRPIVKSAFVTDYAHFQISIESGEDAERERMVGYWTHVVLSAEAGLGPDRGRADATYLAWSHSLQNDFLPNFKPWWQEIGPSERKWWQGISPSERKWPFAMYEISNEFDRWEPRPMNRSEAAEAIPRLIKQLTDSKPTSRSTAEFHLRQWTGKAFGHDWRAHMSNHPTLAEGKAIQAEWRRWWEVNEKKFREERVIPGV
jgi:hypothetical protein